MIIALCYEGLHLVRVLSHVLVAWPDFESYSTHVTEQSRNPTQYNYHVPLVSYLKSVHY